MANGTPEQRRTNRVTGRGRFQAVAQTAGRGLLYAIVAVVITLVGIQFARAIGQVAVARHELASVRGQITQLQRRRNQQQAEIRRLRDPLGTIPEIHDRLRMVRANEEVIFISPAPSPTP